MIYLSNTMKALPSTIRISYRKVRHSADNDDKRSSYDVKVEGE